MIQLEGLLVMQDDLRHWSSLTDMIDYVKSGGFWTPEYLVKYSGRLGLKVSPIIQVSRFEDGLHFVHDGHHRCVSTWIGGRKYLREDEYQLTDWLYEQYLEINHENGWYTPFDPRKHVRGADFAAFKKKAKELFLADPVGAVTWIRDNYDKYRRDKVFPTVPDLASAVKYRHS